MKFDPSVFKNDWISKMWCENVTIEQFQYKFKFIVYAYNLKMWKCEVVKMWNCKNVKLWNCENVKMWNCEIVKLRKLLKCKNVKMWSF